MIKIAEILTTTPGIDYHLKHGLALHENIYRYSSREFIDLFSQARNLYEQGKIDLIQADLDLLLETDIGEYGIFDSKQVPLDLPMLNEAEYQGKKVQLNKPKRGGSKKFYVYVKDPKTKNVRKVSFGAKDGGGNLAVKLKDPKRRKAFADRHNCKDKKDKTKAGYWACRIGRYWKSLGGSQNYPGYW